MMFFHRHRWSMPITIKRLTYQCCLECGSRRAFDYNRWRPGKTLRRERVRTEFSRVA
jgi:hypothetical protein